MDFYHQSVLLNEIVKALRIQKGKKYIDATIGGGGHTFEILKRGGVVLGIDVDEEAIDYVKKEFKIQSSTLRPRSGQAFKIDEKALLVVKGNFREIDKIAHSKRFNNVCGIIFDLGFSSHQIETKERGFSYQDNCPLDMRMDQDLRVKAKDLINVLTKGELYELFFKLGEERRARAIADVIDGARRIRPIGTTEELVRLLLKVYQMKNTFKNRSIASKKVFQALRIAVNDELNNLREALPLAISLLGKNGRLAVISFHSLEDRIVKQFYRQWQEKKYGEILTKKPLLPSEEERTMNARSRGAKLRIFEKN